MLLFLGIIILTLTGSVCSDECSESASTTSEITTPSTTTTTTICPENQTYTNCVNYPTCYNMDPVPSSTVCHDGICYDCGPGCTCLPGYVRDEDGSCIYRNDCPGCGCNEKFNEICVNRPTYCPPSCENPYPEPCPRTVPPTGCECKPGYLRHKNGKCVEPSKCPGGVPTTTSASACYSNETYKDCVTVDASCENLDADTSSTHPICYPGCVCKNGYVRSAGYCILRNDCPGCGCNEKFNEICVNCPNLYCEPSCDNPNPEFCPLLPCQITGCQCKPGLLRHKNGRCVEPSHCPGKKTTSSTSTTTDTSTSTSC